MQAATAEPFARELELVGEPDLEPVLEDPDADPLERSRRYALLDLGVHRIAEALTQPAQHDLPATLARQLEALLVSVRRS
ncbi:MAG TPA: hypothetical protein VHT91_03580 [Kofleriaceae bacterium]|nr:hypothetical protein [Kofleriaceae bacterium]